MAVTVIGLFDSRTGAERAARELLGGGFAAADIGVVAGSGAAAPTTEADRAQDIAAGAGVGAAVGGLGGLAIGLAALAVPGLGPVLAAGPIATALAGAGMGAGAGGILGALAGFGVPDEHAHVYAEALRRGGALLTVDSGLERADFAADVLERHGALDVEEHAARWRQAGWPGFDATVEPLTAEALAFGRSPEPAASEPAMGVEREAGRLRRARVYGATTAADRRDAPPGTGRSEERESPERRRRSA